MVEALSAVGLLSAAGARWWAQREGEAPAIEVPPVAATVAEAFLNGLIEDAVASCSARVPGTSESEWRFDGAVGALAEVGLVDEVFWEQQLRSRLGRRSAEEAMAESRALNAGGTEQELIAVLGGGPDRIAGLRVLYALVFADGVSLVLHGDGRGLDRALREGLASATVWDWELHDDLGTPYRWRRSSGSDRDQYFAFSGTVPAQLRWLELTGLSGETIRMTR